MNSKIAPVERFGISTPARSRGSNRDSRLQKKFQIDQEVDPALRFADFRAQKSRPHKGGRLLKKIAAPPTGGDLWLFHEVLPPWGGRGASAGKKFHFNAQ